MRSLIDLSVERKLASIQKVLEIRPIEGADSIEAIRINGWWVVSQKGEYQVDNPCVYLEIDSWVPTELAPFLSKGREPREYGGVKGERLRTIRLRGQLSQGLVLPLTKLPIGSWNEGDDVTDILDIQKWEAPIPAQLAGQVKGLFPSFIRKTDQERIQNYTEYLTRYKDEPFEVSIKLDGSSMTVYQNDGVFGVCSRNLDLTEDATNSFWVTANRLNLRQILNHIGKNLAIQGELIGEGIQGNPEKLKGHNLYVFDIWDIDNGRYCTPTERQQILDLIPGIQEVPVLERGFRVFEVYDTVDKLLAYSDGPSLNASVREGLVFKSSNRINHDIVSFKVINNNYLLKEK